MREGGAISSALPICFRQVIILERALDGVSKASLARFARRAQQLAGFRGEVNVLIAGNRRLQELNRVFRGKDRPTDVLSFPRNIEDGGGGDIAISADLARSNAGLYRHSASDELRILILHGMLHLAGHDHETDGGRMAKLEARLRSQLKLPGSLIERAASNGRKDLGSKRRSATRGKPSPRRRSR
jgi:probable rRNA maturation factor